VAISGADDTSRQNRDRKCPGPEHLQFQHRVGTPLGVEPIGGEDRQGQRDQERLQRIVDGVPAQIFNGELRRPHAAGDDDEARDVEGRRARQADFRDIAQRHRDAGEPDGNVDVEIPMPGE